MARLTRSQTHSGLTDAAREILEVLFETKKGPLERELGRPVSWLEVARAVQAALAEDLEHTMQASRNPLHLFAFIFQAKKIRIWLEEIEPQPDLGEFVAPLPPCCERYLTEIS